jgi:hypothetical protein
MNVKSALKLKNKILSDIKAQHQILHKYNSIEEGNVRKYSMNETLNKLKNLTKDLVELKTKIHLANKPVYHLIFELAELKGMIKELRKVPTDEGKITERYGSVQTIKTVELDVIAMESIIEGLQASIDEIQSELDLHNSVTEI